MKKTNLKSAALLSLTAIIWGVAFVAQSEGMNYVGAFTFNFVRSMIGSIVLLPCISFLNHTMNDRNMKEKEKKGIDKILLIGGICCGLILFISSNLQQIGVQYTSAGKAGFITALYIVLVPICGIFIKRYVGIRIWVSVLIALCGLYLLCVTETLSFGKGDGYLLAGAVGFTIHILVIDYFVSRADAVKMACIQFFVTGFLSGILMLIFETPKVSDILAGWLPILYAGVLSCGVAYTLQIVGQKEMNPSVASLILSFEAVISVVAGFIILGEALSGRELIGCVLMFIAIILAQIPQRQNSKRTTVKRQ